MTITLGNIKETIVNFLLQHDYTGIMKHHLPLGRLGQLEGVLDVVQPDIIGISQVE